MGRFMCGAMFYMGVTMAVQDGYGLERYIDHLRHDWIYMSPLVGAGIAAFAVCASCVSAVVDALESL